MNYFRLRKYLNSEDNLEKEIELLELKKTSLKNENEILYKQNTKIRSDIKHLEDEYNIDKINKQITNIKNELLSYQKILLDEKSKLKDLIKLQTNIKDDIDRFNKEKNCLDLHIKKLKKNFFRSDKDGEINLENIRLNARGTIIKIPYYSAIEIPYIKYYLQFKNVLNKKNVETKNEIDDTIHININPSYLHQIIDYIEYGIEIDYIDINILANLGYSEDDNICKKFFKSNTEEYKNVKIIYKHNSNREVSYFRKFLFRFDYLNLINLPKLNRYIINNIKSNYNVFIPDNDFIIVGSIIHIIVNNKSNLNEYFMKSYCTRYILNKYNCEDICKKYFDKSEDEIKVIKYIKQVFNDYS